MNTTTDDPAPLLHPRLARFDPALSPGRRGAPRTRVIAGTLGACLALTFAAHAFPGPPASATAASRELAPARATAVPTRVLPAI